MATGVVASAGEAAVVEEASGFTNALHMVLCMEGGAEVAWSHGAWRESHSKTQTGDKLG